MGDADRLFQRDFIRTFLCLLSLGILIEFVSTEQVANKNHIID